MYRMYDGQESDGSLNSSFWSDEEERVAEEEDSPPPEPNHHEDSVRQRVDGEEEERCSSRTSGYGTVRPGDDRSPCSFAGFDAESDYETRPGSGDPEAKVEVCGGDEEENRCEPQQGGGEDEDNVESDDSGNRDIKFIDSSWATVETRGNLRQTRGNASSERWS